MLLSLTGKSGAGKSTIANCLYSRLKPELPGLALLDGDSLRSAIFPDLGHSPAERTQSEATRCKLAQLLCAQELHLIIAAISNDEYWRTWCRANIPGYFEVYVRVSDEVLACRDSKGLYEGARAGRITNVVGVDIPFHEPDNCDLVIDNNGDRSAGEIAQTIEQFAWQHLSGVTTKVAVTYKV